MDTCCLDTLYLRQEGLEDPWLFFEIKRGPPAERLGNIALQKYPCINELQLTQIVIKVCRPILMELKIEPRQISGFRTFSVSSLGPFPTPKIQNVIKLGEILDSNCDVKSINN